MDALTAKHEGMERGYRGADPQWKEVMFTAVRSVAQRRRLFTSDDVMEEFDRQEKQPTTPDKRALGPIMRRAAIAGLCQKASVLPTPSRRKDRHAGPNTVWESLEYLHVGP